MKKSILICTPYLNKIGGTELEAIVTAIYLYDSGDFQNVSIFSPGVINEKIFKELLGGRKLKMFTYPPFLLSSVVEFVNRIFFKLGFKRKISEYIYWKFKSIKPSSFFILTYPKSSYFFSILESVPSSKKVIAKVTMGQLDMLPNNHVDLYKRFDKIIVFNEKQKTFWESNYKFNQVLALDIMIPNEENLLNVDSHELLNSENLTFGFLGRIVREKNIMDMILLLDYLNNKSNFRCRLIIQGDGDAEYIEELKLKIKELNLTKFITFNNWMIEPMHTHNFFNKISIFFVTSIWEGGPITALEAAAAGRIILSYDIGAMNDRFENIPFCINNDFHNLCSSALEIISMDFNKRLDLSIKVKEQYITNLSNNKKGIDFLKALSK